jgi:hypothetical protein
MEPFSKREFIIEYVLKVCLVVGLAGLTVLFLPGDMFDISLAMIPLGDWLWALVAGLVGGLTALVADCVIVETACMVLKVIRRGRQGPSVRPRMEDFLRDCLRYWPARSCGRCVTWGG